MDIISRAKWGARHGDGFTGAPTPASEVWLHHSVTIAPDLAWLDADKDGVDDDEEKAMRLLESIGQDRFGGGISYTWLIMPSGRIYQGHSPWRQGAHTGGRNDRARAICLVGNYEDRDPTPAQIRAAAWLLQYAQSKKWIRYARLNGGHRDLKSTACPGSRAYARIAEINRLAAGGPIGGGAAPGQEDDDMDAKQFLALLKDPAVIRQMHGINWGAPHVPLHTDRETGHREYPETQLYSLRERLTREQFEPIRRQVAALTDLVGKQGNVSAEEIAAAMRAGIVADVLPVLREVLADALDDDNGDQADQISDAVLAKLGAKLNPEGSTTA